METSVCLTRRSTRPLIRRRSIEGSKSQSVSHDVGGGRPENLTFRRFPPRSVVQSTLSVTHVAFIFEQKCGSSNRQHDPKRGRFGFKSWKTLDTSLDIPPDLFKLLRKHLNTRSGPTGKHAAATMHEIEQIARIARALASETRLRILAELTRRTLCGNALARTLGVTPAAVSQHLRILREAGLVEEHRRGYRKHYQVAPEALRRCCSFLETLARCPETERPAQQPCCGPQPVVEQGEPDHVQQQE